MVGHSLNATPALVNQIKNVIAELHKKADSTSILQMSNFWHQAVSKCFIVCPFFIMKKVQICPFFMDFSFLFYAWTPVHTLPLVS